MIEPTIKTDQYELYLADCLDVLPQLEGVDAVVTDPPYGIGFKYNIHDDSPDGYGEMLGRVLSLCAEASSDDAPFFVWQGMKNAPQWHQWFPKDFRILAACKGFVQFRPTVPQYGFDPVIHWGKCKAKPSVFLRDYHVQRLAPFGAGRPKIEHPCPRPLEQVRYFVEMVGEGAPTVLDPFMGSGTTGVAAIELGHRFVGIEIDPDYFEIAHKRIKHAASQRRMFA